jgi:hypothetical protein
MSMPNIPQSELPTPKSWDDFEDIVADLYIRLWDDPHAQRYGRSGQAQQGVDIYGQPDRLQSGYVGVQCKRYAVGTLTLRIVKDEITKAEEFEPSLAEYILATTDRRNAVLQKAIRELNEERHAAKKFPVYIVFWEDLCSLLADPDNRDILRKHYGDWMAHYSASRIDIVKDKLLDFELNGITKEQKTSISRELERLMQEAIAERSATDARVIQEMRNRLDDLVPSQMLPNHQGHLPRLRRLIDQHFNLEELHDLCFDLGIEYENLPGRTKRGNCRELIAYCQRHGRIPSLLKELNRHRPGVPWEASEI